MEERSSPRLGDYTVTPRVITISLIAIVIGVAASYVAWALLKLIGLATNIFFYQRIRFDLVSPANHHLGAWEIVIPIIGGLLVGLMARYGSERIRGHGMPEAIESILLRGSKVDPKVAVMKPISSAVSIGSGGPFGAEGPIIMTGGAIGSLIAQFFHLTDSERKTLLVAGSAAGMTAIFATPIAAVVLAFELLLFEFKPRSLIPVALACATAAAARVYLLGPGPLFAKEPHPINYSPAVLIGCIALGLLCAVMSQALTRIVYAAEDAFERLPVHWMWWPILGGAIIGIGGLFFPRGLGVGYDLIADLLQDRVTVGLIVGIVIAKSLMWSLSLGSGTSGGIVAPLLIIGGGVGAGCQHFLPWLFPFEGPGFWALLGMAAVLGSTIGAPLMCIIFAVELTQDMNMFLPLLLTVIVAHAVNVLILNRSILTEKISRRGFHVSREYAVDPLEIMSTKEVMRTNVVALPCTLSVQDLRNSFATQHARRGQWLYPIVNEEAALLGVLTRGEIQRMIAEQDGDPSPEVLLKELCPQEREIFVAFPDEPLRVVVNRMAAVGVTRFPVVERRSARREHGRKEQRRSEAANKRLVGLVSLTDLLKARVANLNAEQNRERVLPIRIFLPSRFRP